MNAFSRPFSTIASLLFLLPAVTALHAAEEDLDHGRTMMIDSFQYEVDALSETWLDGVETLEDWEARRKELRQQLAEMVGLHPLPEKTDLKVTVTGTVEHDEFTVLKLHYQSLPGLYVTANLYLPDNRSAPAPTVLYLCGHASRVSDGISYGSKVAYQRHPAWYARHGMVSLVIDPLDNGEIRGVHHGTYRHDRWWWYNRGYTPAAIEVWNAIRALDFLESRDEVDANRIGVTGRSGGGMYSWLLLALDDRPVVATPTAGITDLQNHLIDDVISGHCDCNYWNNFHRLDTPVMAALAAPRPVRLLNTDNDRIFPEDGIRRVDEQVRRVYALYGKEDRWDVFIGDGPHGDTEELRENTFPWMYRWLTGKSLSEVRPAEEFFSQEELRVFDQLPADERNTRIDEEFIPVQEDPSVPKDPDSWEAMKGEWMNELAAKPFAGWPEESDNPPALSRLHRMELDTNVLEVHDFSPQKGISLRFWSLRPAAAEPERAIVRVVNDEGWLEWLAILQTLAPDRAEELVGPGARAVEWPAPDPQKLRPLRQQLDEQTAVFVVAPRGIGPTRFEIEGNRGDTIRRSYQMLGQTLDGMRVWDVRRALAAAKSLPDIKTLPVEVEASGTMAVVALYASLFDEPVSKLRLRELPDTHRNGPYLLNIDQIVQPPQVLAMARDRSEVTVRKNSTDTNE